MYASIVTEIEKHITAFAIQSKPSLELLMINDVKDRMTYDIRELISSSIKSVDKSHCQVFLEVLNVANCRPINGTFFASLQGKLYTEKFLKFDQLLNKRHNAYDECKKYYEELCKKYDLYTKKYIEELKGLFKEVDKCYNLLYNGKYNVLNMPHYRSKYHPSLFDDINKIKQKLDKYDLEFKQYKQDCILDSKKFWDYLTSKYTNKEIENKLNDIYYLEYNSETYKNPKHRYEAREKVFNKIELYDKDTYIQMMNNKEVRDNKIDSQNKAENIVKNQYPEFSNRVLEQAMGFMSNHEFVKKEQQKKEKEQKNINI